MRSSKMFYLSGCEFTEHDQKPTNIGNLTGDKQPLTSQTSMRNFKSKTDDIDLNVILKYGAVVIGHAGAPVIFLVLLRVSHHVLISWRGSVCPAQRPLQAGSAHYRDSNIKRAVFQLEPLVGHSRRGDDVHSAQQVVVPAAVPVPDLEAD